MTRKEIEKRIDEIKTNRFYLAMKDRWSAEDFEHDRKLVNELIELKNKLKEED